jgi:F-type H+/Na+-transporting ATPase subunit beta
VYVPIAESIRGFKEILEGKHDDLPERAFFMKGTIDDVVRDARGEEQAEEKRDDEAKVQDEAGRGPEGSTEESSEGDSGDQE